MSTVCAVVLTYNRKDLLNDCLAALCAQTRGCDRIIVVDNASRDGTPEMLARQWAERVTSYLLPANIGAAGGFTLGMQLGYQTGADYIWVMDDDVIAAPNALERLLVAEDVLIERNYAAPFVISSARCPAGLLTNVPEVDRRSNALNYSNWPDLLEHSMVPVTRATFVSILLPRTTMLEYGLPIPAMFIWGEDSEYTMRITRGHPAYIVGDSRVVHVRQTAGVLDIRTETSPARIAYHAHRIRNDIYIKRRYENFSEVVRYLRRQAKLAARLCREQGFAKAAIVLRGVIAGLRFNPQILTADAAPDMTGIRIIGPAAQPNAVAPARRPPADQKIGASLAFSSGHFASLSEMAVTASGQAMPSAGSS
ncbi:MAG: glycosyl transferase [Belnapia sp.]|nr:glycosyl transferase [Belnapia sp.]